MSTFKFELGERVRDVYTNFTGVLVSRAQYLGYPSNCYTVQPTAKEDGSLPSAESFDEQRLMLVD